MTNLNGWFQRLRQNGIRGLFSDDMATAQTAVEGSTGAPAAQGPSVASLLGDEEIKGLIDRRRNGDKLSPAENGKLGAYAARTGTKLPGRPKAVAAAAAGMDAGTGQPVPQAGGPMPDVVADSCKAVCQTLLQAADELKAMTVGSKISKLGFLTAAQEKEFVERAKMPASTKTVLVESSPAVVASLNIPPDKFPIGAFCSVLAIEGARFTMILNELNQLAKEAKTLQRAEPDKKPE